MGKQNLIVGLDIGTTKIAVIISELEESGPPRIVGMGTSRSEGLKRGVVINLEKTVESITKALEDAEMMAGVKVNSVFAGIAGDHIRSINSRGVIALSGSGSEISSKDVERVINAARAVALPMDREIIHVLPQEYTVDDQSGIKDPIGMSGVRLEAEVHIVTGAVTSAQNIYRSVKKAGLEVCDLVLQPLASSYALLSPEEEELGVALIDLGGGTTDIAIFHDGSIRHTAVIGLGGNNVTNDIAIGLRTPVEQAEEIKKSYGCALSSLVDSDEMIKVPGVGGRGPKEISRGVLAAIIEPRAEEIFSLVLREIKKTNYSDLLVAGVVLTGGGSLMEGMIELAEQIFDMPAKKGIPQGFSGLVDLVSTPIHSTGVGLILYGLEQLKDGKSKGGSKEKGWFRRMKNLFGQYF
ncbi:MAG: cell division protein FtsA [candidate division Zixibacteria bacterium]|nr:cell division protein FtsA [candidate division Zixibacteria bacterium]